MLPSFVILFFCALVTAFSAGDPQEKWGGYGGHGDISHGGNNIGNGDVGGIVGDVGIGGGSGGGCDPAACDAKCKSLGFPSGFCDNEGASPSLLGLILGGTTPSCFNLYGYYYNHRYVHQHRYEHNNRYEHNHGYCHPYSHLLLLFQPSAACKWRTPRKLRPSDIFYLY
ncbi:hypothetical protein PMG11_06412 [Penicillium brasilianum]|uniref:Uncharacterized protein n=1 Tax=Penicillium brasilianum TaxID=104259 RepID=A0A0F7TLS2_PENBI|nr:hypothetical protein PMG11_06412 [Penicillium brasilianum]